MGIAVVAEFNGFTMPQFNICISAAIGAFAGILSVTPCEVFLTAQLDAAAARIHQRMGIAVVAEFNGFTMPQFNICISAATQSL